MIGRPRRALAAGLVALASCSGPPTLSPEFPPPGWAEEIREWRSRKDDQFRDAAASPLAETLRPEFRGLEYWPLDPSVRLVGRIERYATPEPFRMATTTGEVRPAERYGRVTFDRDGTRCSLQVYRFLDEPRRPGGEAFFLPFADATSGKETYPGGRFVELDGPEGGPFLLDFNRAYNPFCAYGRADRWQCPVTPAENRLAVPIRAGERGFARHP